MLIGILADTHDRVPTLRAALGRFRDAGVSTLLHAGDIVAPFAARPLAEFGAAVHVVFGNNDGERSGLRRVLPQIVDGPLRIELAGRNILMSHFMDWLRPEDLRGADVVITAHTHQLKVSRDAGRLMLNPGECCGWVTGRCTAILLDLVSLETHIMEGFE